MTEELKTAGEGAPAKQHLGEIALQAPEERQLFAVANESLETLAPSLVAAREAFQAFLTSANPRPAQPNGETDELRDDTEPLHQAHRPGRGELRQGKSIYAGHIARLIRTGANYLATFDDQEEAIRAGRHVIPEVLDEHLGELYLTRIVPAAEPLRRVRTAQQQVSAEIRELLGKEDQIAGRYELIKAFIGQKKDADDADTRKQLFQEVSSRGVLVTMVAMEGSDIPRALTEELQSGAFDPLIAQELLRYIEDQPGSENGLLRLRQLVTFLGAFLGNDQADHAQVHRRMIETLDEWPSAQRQVILETRQALVTQMEVNLGRVTRALRESNFIGIEDAEDAFGRSLERLSDEMLKRVEISSENRAEIMRLRLETKRARFTPKRQRNKRAAEVVAQAAETAEEERRPLRLVTCNLNDFSVVEGVDGIIEEFVRQVGGNSPVLRDDLWRMVNFMARTDLPPDFRRGVKAIQASKVKFGLEDDPDKLWDFFEFKPTEAAGLPTKSQLAKNSRIYFIKMGDETLGIIGIKAKSEQDNFLRSIRTKIKRRD